MSVRLHLDVDRWRTHLRSRADAVPGIVPVAKGNGYGFGLGRLAAEAQTLGASTLAVGTSFEVAPLRAASRTVDRQPFDGWTGDVVVLTPWSPLDTTGTALLADDRVILTVGRIDDLRRLAAEQPGARVLVDVETSMHRHGLPLGDLPKVADALGDLRFEGWTIHLPMVESHPGSRLAEATALAGTATAIVPGPVWLSHLADDEYASISNQLAQRGIETRLRQGTSLWLGDAGCRRTTARVLDVHSIQRGERLGYWQRRIPFDGWVVVIAGGTSHGVALEAPTAAASVRQRAVSMVAGSLEAAGLALSPFTVSGRKRFFVEPPHMQSSLVFLPGSCSVAIGDEVPVELRLTTATVDEIVPA